MAGYEGSPYKQDDVAVGPSVGGSKQQFDVPVNKIKRGLRKTTLWHISVSLVSSIFIFLIFQCALQLKSTREQRGTARRLAGQAPSCTPDQDQTHDDVSEGPAQEHPEPEFPEPPSPLIEVLGASDDESPPSHRPSVDLPGPSDVFSGVGAPEPTYGDDTEEPPPPYESSWDSGKQQRTSLVKPPEGSDNEESWMGQTWGEELYGGGRRGDSEEEGGARRPGGMVEWQHEETSGSRQPSSSSSSATGRWSWLPGGDSRRQSVWDNYPFQSGDSLERRLQRLSLLTAKFPSLRRGSSLTGGSEDEAPPRPAQSPTPRKPSVSNKPGPGWAVWEVETTSEEPPQESATGAPEETPAPETSRGSTAAGDEGQEDTKEGEEAGQGAPAEHYPSDASQAEEHPSQASQAEEPTPQTTEAEPEETHAAQARQPHPSHKGWEEPQISREGQEEPHTSQGAEAHHHHRRHHHHYTLSAAKLKSAAAAMGKKLKGVFRRQSKPKQGWEFPEISCPEAQKELGLVMEFISDLSHPHSPLLQGHTSMVYRGIFFDITVIEQKGFPGWPQPLHLDLIRNDLQSLVGRLVGLFDMEEDEMTLEDVVDIKSEIGETLIGQIQVRIVAQRPAVRRGSPGDESPDDQRDPSA